VNLKTELPFARNSPSRLSSLAISDSVEWVAPSTSTISLTS
jgi:hypothetical protein